MESVAQKDLNNLPKVLVSGEIKLRFQSMWLKSCFFTHHILDFVSTTLKTGDIELFLVKWN